MPGIGAGNGTGNRAKQNKDPSLWDGPTIPHQTNRLVNILWFIKEREKHNINGWQGGWLKFKIK